MSNASGYAGFSRCDLDREYSPSSLVSSLPAYLDDYARLSAAARTRHGRVEELRYGSLPEATLDLFPVDQPDAPVMVFVHGGYWQELTKRDSEFAATSFLSAGIAFAAIDYGLAPDHTLDDIVTMVRSSIAWLHANALRFGIDPRRIHVSGSSAGAHLVAMALVADCAQQIASATLLSGIYDLEPLRHTYVNDALGLDLDAAVRNSPIYRLPLQLPPVVIARGGIETSEFIRQHDTMSGLLRQRARVTEIIGPARNHFDLPYDLGDPSTELGRAVLSNIVASTGVQAESA
ncbi:alpha/beta hydrolase [Nocardiaceae bacterium YC2-7]|uniref:Alpha/beta hydrolase n=1 Tax=Antrihabitans stalactiti TaxID=2584121 RepID=A0A848KBB3_9NOCA|nr:alpha/beta hydrolase [Antrihabitans stalactiti]